MKERVIEGSFAVDVGEMQTSDVAQRIGDRRLQDVKGPSAHDQIE
jgi:hypothetical protein